MLTYNNGSDPGSLSYDAATNKLTFISDGGAMGNLVIDLTAVNDTLVEGDETYTVALATPTSTTGSAIALGANNTVTTIIDNDTATWSITGETSVTESAVNNTASYTVNLGGTLQSGENASIVLSLTNNTTNPDGSDLATETQFDAAVAAAVLTYNNGSDPGSLSYDAATNKLTFISDGGAMGNLVIDLTAVNDTLVEGDETYTVALATPTSTTGSAIALGANNTVTTIIDNDTATWSITGETSVTESAVNNTASYTVNLGGTLQSGENASIVLSLTNNTTNPDGSDLATEAQFDAAVAAAVLTYNNGSDPGSLSYDAATNKLTFISDGGAMGNLVIDLTAVNDTLVEGDETYTVALATPTSTTGSAIALGANNTVTTIIDNDTATWSITGETSVTEICRQQHGQLHGELGRHAAVGRERLDRVESDQQHHQPGRQRPGHGSAIRRRGRGCGADVQQRL